jgi:hypothetical protein
LRIWISFRSFLSSSVEPVRILAAGAGNVYTKDPRRFLLNSVGIACRSPPSRYQIIGSTFHCPQSLSFISHYMCSSKHNSRSVVTAVVVRCQREHYTVEQRCCHAHWNSIFVVTVFFISCT